MIFTILDNVMDMTSLKVYAGNALALILGSTTGILGIILGTLVSAATLAYTILRCMNEWKKYKSEH